MSSLFLHPLLLALLAAAVLPWVIEWLFRRRKRQVELPTLRFLLNTQEQKKVRRQDRILLWLRTLAIALLVAALARPLLQHGWVGGQRQRHVVVLLDGTASMHQQRDVTTAFGLAQKKAAAVIRALPATSKVTVVLLGERVVPIVTEEADLPTAAARVEGLRAGAGAAPIDAGLAWVKDHIAGHNLDTIELYLFSDFQKHTWSRPGRQAETAQALSDLDGHCETYLIDVGGQPSFNYLVTLLRPDEFVLSAGKAVSFLAEVQCAGQPPADARATVTFLVDGVKKAVREVALGGQPVPLEFVYRFPRAGEYLVEVVVDGDEYRVDNRRLYLCQVAQDVSVLVLDDSADTPQPDSNFLTRAIRPPAHPGMEKVSHFEVKTINPERIAYENLSSYAVVVLTGTSRLSEAMASQLERYVADGGALWFFLSDTVNLYDYNKYFWKDGKGPLPAQLLDRAAASADGAVFPRFGEIAHAALRQFTRLAGGPEMAVQRYLRLDVPPTATVVLPLSNGVPLLVEKAHGRGKVLLANMTAGLGWTYLPALPEFPMLVQEVLAYLVGNPDAGVNLNVGDRFDQPVFVSTQHLLLRYPDGAKYRLTPERRPGSADVYHVVFEDTTQQGLYQVEAIEEVLPRRRFVVNLGAEESEPSRLSRREFADAYAAGGWTWIDSDTSIEDLAAQLHTVTELFPPIIATLLGVLAVESLLAWRFGRRRGEVTP